MKRNGSLLLLICVGMLLCACSPAFEYPMSKTDVPHAPTIPVQTTEAHASVDIPQAYKEILGNVVNAFPWNDDPETVVPQHPELSYLYRFHAALSDIGFAVTDLDGNGQQELILADMEYQMVFDLFTLVDGKAVHLLDGGERYRHYLRAGGVVENEWSGSAIMSGNDFWEISGGQLLFLERIVYDGFHAEDIGLAEDAWEAGPERSYFRSFSTDAAQYQHITHEEAEQILDSYRSTYPLLEIPYIPLSQYEHQ